MCHNHLEAELLIPRAFPRVHLVEQLESCQLVPTEEVGSFSYHLKKLDFNWSQRRSPGVALSVLYFLIFEVVYMDARRFFLCFLCYFLFPVSLSIQVNDQKVVIS
jgi:hypothetical protein